MQVAFDMGVEVAGGKKEEEEEGGTKGQKYFSQTVSYGRAGRADWGARESRRRG
jgi:hypothetical protein